MPLDAEAIRRGCRSADVTTANHLCRSEIGQFHAALAEGSPVTVGCTQESPLFTEEAGEQIEAVSFVNVRESAGWSVDGARAGPKMAALFAAAAEPMPDYPLINLSSDGVILIYGRDERAIEAGKLLAEHLDVTVLIEKPDALTPPRVADFPIVKGTIRTAKGHLGAFELTVDDFAAPLPSSRDRMVFAASRDGTTSHCDLVLDLTGGAPLFPAHELRDGYLRADPGDPAAVLRAVMKARDLTGSFDKPRYVNFSGNLCAHSRSTIVGCHRCLDLCPTGAITPAGDQVVINAEVCAGCGQCAAVCPTGAASYALPPADALLRKVRTMLSAYRAAGGEQAVILLHDDDHGGALIDVLARFGDGLPHNVIPLAVNEITQIGLETIAAAFAYGASGMRFLVRAKPRHDLAGLYKTFALAEPILTGLGFGIDRIATIETDDPDILSEALRAIQPAPAAAKPASFMPVGGKREIMRLAVRELHRVAPAPVDIIALPQGAPFGTVNVNAEGCTLCLSCVSSCPTGALSDDPDKPMLRFSEDACVQCGLCVATCPEKVISLTPQIDFRAATARTRIIKEEQPAHCIRCGTAFGVKSSVDRVVAKLEGKHWMFKNSARRLDVVRMCADCRVIAMSEEKFDPFAGVPERAPPRTTDDYLREREEKPRT
ncbi:MAG: 4Fe-4S binding protein [Variibacter sp.]